MPTVSLNAHFDGKEICLDEPFALPINARLLVTILPNGDDEFRTDWARLSAAALSRAYGDDEPEYTEADVRR